MGDLGGVRESGPRSMIHDVFRSESEVVSFQASQVNRGTARFGRNARANVTEPRQMLRSCRRWVVTMQHNKFSSVLLCLIQSGRITLYVIRISGLELQEITRKTRLMSAVMIYILDQKQLLSQNRFQEHNTESNVDSGGKSVFT